MMHILLAFVLVGAFQVVHSDKLAEGVSQCVDTCDVDAQVEHAVEGVAVVIA